MAEPQIRWSLHKTPNPAEKMFSVLASMPEIAQKIAEYNAYTEGSLFSDFPNVPDEWLAKPETFGNYIYKDCDDDAPGWMRFYFVKTKTPAERNTPFERRRITQRLDWDAVLEWIQFGIDTGFPLSQNTINGQGRQALVTADRWLVPRGYRSAQNLMTTVDIEIFMSEIPWPEYLMESDEPQPTEVMWDLTGSHGSMGKCLHDTVPVPAQSTAGYRVVTSVGDIQSANATGTKRWLFPKTNHKKRRDYTVISVEFVSFQYLLTKYTYRVPNQPKIIQQS